MRPEHLSATPGFHLADFSAPGVQTAKYISQILSRNKDGGSNPDPPFNLLTQAENYNIMNGVQTEGTTDTGGGLNVGYIDTGDWMAYNGITIPSHSRDLSLLPN